MTYIGLDKKFSLLVQEAHLIKNTLLSGFDLLLKANFFQDKDGYFYSAFFNISIGMERILKLAVVTNHMLTNNYQTPTIKWLKNTFRHDISILYNDSLKMIPVYLNQQVTPTTKAAHDEALIYFFTEYGIGSRYFNLNEVCEAKMDRSPLDKWVDLANSINNEYTPPHIREKSAMNLLYKMDRDGQSNEFTSHLNEGHPMMVFDCLHRQYVIERSAPLIIWRLVEVLKPIHFLLEAMAYKAADYEVANKISSMVIPHYEDFFYFLLADKSSIKRRKKWLDIFQR